MNEDKILDKIRTSAEHTDIPDSLSPDSIQEQLRHTDNDKHALPIYRIASVMAAVFVVILGGWGLFQAFDGEDLDNLTDTVSTPQSMGSLETAESIDPADLAAIEAGSYEELYTAVDKLNRAVNTYDAGYAVDAAIPEDAVTSSETYDSGTESAEIATEDSSSASSKAYDPELDSHSTTNTQTAGVDEGDIVKTDGSYIYILTSGRIRIVDATRMTLANEITLDTYDKTLEDMYLADGRLLAIASGTTSELNSSSEGTYQVSSQTVTTIYTYNITDPAAPSLTGSVDQSGSYASSRRNGEYLYLFTTFDTVLPEARTSYEDYVPCVGGSLIPEEDIYIPEIRQYTQQLVISSVNVNAPEKIVDQKSILSGADLYYVSDKHIFTANSQWNGSGEITQLISFSYDNGSITAKAAGSIPGYINDNFSLDEYDGHLRAVTTYYEQELSNSGEEVTSVSQELNGLYVLDEGLNIVGKLDNLAHGETVHSARFMGDTGYFVTYEQMDPLFSVDLSDPRNPQLLGELKITGFSEYLHFYDEDLLLGIGWESDPDTGEVKGLKLSMFDISDPANVTEKHKLVIKDVYSCTGINNYKAVMIDPEKNLFGFAYEGDTNDGSNTFANYGLFSYDKANGFISEFTCSLDNDPDGYTSIWDTRGLYINDTFYLSTARELTSFDIDDDYKALNKLNW